MTNEDKISYTEKHFDEVRHSVIFQFVVLRYKIHKMMMDGIEDLKNGRCRNLSPKEFKELKKRVEMFLQGKRKSLA